MEEPVAGLWPPPPHIREAEPGEQQEPTCWCARPRSRKWRSAGGAAPSPRSTGRSSAPCQTFLPPSTEEDTARKSAGRCKDCHRPVTQGYGSPCPLCQLAMYLPVFLGPSAQDRSLRGKEEEVWSVDTSSTWIKVSSLLFLKFHDIQFRYVTFIQLSLNRCKLCDSVSTNSVLWSLLNLSPLS